MSREKCDRRKITPTGGMLLKWATRRSFVLVAFILESLRVFVTIRLNEKMKLSVRECVAAVPSETSPVGNSSLMITPQ